MFKKIFFLLLTTTIQLTFAQDFSSNWKSHFSYNDIVAITGSETNIYAAASNSIFIHSIAQNTNKQFTTVNGLSAEDIGIINYDSLRGLIIVGFTNGLIEIINENTNEVTSLNDITTQINFPVDQIKINDFFIDEDTLYVATGFGIVEYDLENRVFKSTYLLSDSLSVVSDITGVGVLGDSIIASIAGRGTFSGNKNDPNLIEFSNWELRQPEVFENFKPLTDKLIASNGNSLFNFNGQIFQPVFNNPDTLINYSVTSNTLLVTTPNRLINLDANFSLLEEFTLPQDLEGSINDSLLIGNEIYFPAAQSGLLRSNNLNFSNLTSLSPRGPESNDIYELDANNGDVWVVHGKLSSSYNFSTPRDQGISRLRNNEWFNIPFSDINQPYIVNAKIDQNDPSKVYFSSYGGGLLEYNESSNSFTNFNNENSNVEEVNNVSALLDLEFSNNGDLWLINNFTPRIAKCFKNNTNNANDIDFSSVIPENGFSIRAESLAFSQNGNLFLGTWLNGLIGYNFENNRFIKLNEEVNNNIPFVTVRTIAFDLNGALWLGTNNGLRVINNPDALFNNANSELRAESIIILDDGVPQELLFQQFITDIQVDAENNKWIATLGAGLFLVSPDGEETLEHFTTSNSPLPSNDINKIAIDQSNGNLYIGTSRGFIEFESNIVAAEENLNQLKVFPNPVRPQYGEVTVRIEGLTAGANVKITDIEGNLVFEDQNPVVNGIGSGLIEWDTRSFSGNKVASGVYLILINSGDQTETSVEKLLIVR